jgi:hypothetical protein
MFAAVLLVQRGNRIAGHKGGWGRALGQGSGTITGNQVQFSLRHPQYGYGTGTGTASSDGRQVSGEIRYRSQRFGFNIFKN